MDLDGQVQFLYRHGCRRIQCGRRDAASVSNHFRDGLIVSAPREVRIWEWYWLSSARFGITPIELDSVVSEKCDCSNMEGAGYSVYAHQSLRLRLCLLLFIVARHGRATLAFKGVP